MPFKLTGVVRIELTLTVLETAVLPLNYTPILDSYVTLSHQRMLL